MRAILTSKWTKSGVFMLSLVPFALLVWNSVGNKLGANPVESLQHATGDWALRFLVFTLCITPFRKMFHLPELIRFRRMLGLFAFFYVCLHFFTYLGPDQNFSLSAMLKDVVKRPFITLGFAAFVLMIPLALTSTAGMIRRLGGKRWQQLHRLIYVCAILAVVHYYWLVKSDIRKPLVYGVLVALLLLWRILNRRKTTASAKATAAATT